ncbi:SURF1 family protein [Tropicimonas sp. IMCC6043]|uniref:SURF1 family protein n=1 Tax=Tropicimonas sp. IMCC6043 TaxID=2510645 RepID=UPI00101BDFA5|nr:SURF1 family protein [Tropicimonas sp. IMCC6043]RYH10691.1 SURF1 family protein [Tropicimonas sp. IMCC6043]
MRRYIAPLLIGLVGAGILVALGLWQLQRLAWKEAILDEIETRIHAAPTAIPAVPDPARDQYLPVRVTGTTGPRELDVLVSTRMLGPGFRIVTALETEDGRRLLLDRGFVPAEAKTTPRPPTVLEVTGNLHWPDERDRFTPDNDPASNYWYAREVDVLADVLGTEPVLVVARATVPADPAITPLPVDTAGIPNNHFGYAIQWFGFAAVWLGMTALLLWRISRRTP